MLKQKNEAVSRELLRYPRGARGSAQNLFRAVYRWLRMSSLGSKRLWSGSAAECADRAAAIVRGYHPGFTPHTV